LIIIVGGDSSNFITWDVTNHHIPVIEMRSVVLDKDPLTPKLYPD
jgi:hypothetical protein